MAPKALVERKKMKMKMKTTKKKRNQSKESSLKFCETEENLNEVEEKKENISLRNNKKLKMTKKKINQSNESILNFSEPDKKSNEMGEKTENKYLGKKKRKGEKRNEVDSGKVGRISIEDEVIEDAEGKKTKDKSARRKKRKCGETDKAATSNAAGSTQSEFKENIFQDTDVAIGKQNGKSRKAVKKKKKDRPIMETDEILVKSEEAAMDEVYQIPSGDKDSSKGMKKWVMEYHESRPGLQILQQKIDDFITEHEEQEEQARKEREDRLAEGGWTVVVHHKGRKKTTDSESGVTVGSVAQAVVLDKLSKKKSHEVGNFYRFQKREAQRSELMKLRSKFEDDKRRMQQLRAARKFKPY